MIHSNGWHSALLPIWKQWGDLESNYFTKCVETIWKINVYKDLNVLRLIAAFFAHWNLIDLTACLAFWPRVTFITRVLSDIHGNALVNIYSNTFLYHSLFTLECRTCFYYFDTMEHVHQTELSVHISCLILPSTSIWNHSMMVFLFCKRMQLQV